MSDPSRAAVLHDFHRASRKAEESALRRFQAAAWLETFIGPLGLSDQPSELEFVSCLRNGLVLCNLINKIHPGTVPKVIESHGNSFESTPNHETQPLPAYQYFENVRNFLVALEELKLPAFEASDLERDSLDAGSTDKIVDCILSLKSYYEWKEWSGGVIGMSRHLKSPVTIRSSSRNQLRVASSNGACRNLDMAINNEKTSPQENGSEKLEGSVVGAFVECLLDSKENVDHKLLDSFRNGTKDSVKAFGRLMAGCLQDQQLDQFPELKAILCDPSEEENTSKLILTENASSAAKCKLLSCLKRGNCNHWKILKVQEKDLSDLKVLLSKTKDEFQVLQSQFQNDLQELGNKVQEISHAARGYQRVIKENRNLYNMVQDLKGNIRVYCRIRPIVGTETRTAIEHIGDDGSLVVLDPLRPHKDARKIFQFNRVFGPTCSQDDVYKETQPLIRSVMDGYNVCIFAYGQTGSGKTHTMSGPSAGSSKDMGINYLALNDLFEISCTRKDIVNYEIHVQMVEIYNEQVRDLLTEDSSTTKLEIRSCTNNGGLSLPHATMHVVKSPRDVLNLMAQGEMNRCVSSTAINHQSSRSHSVLTVHVHGKDVSGNILRSCLHLVDLAGSERVDKSEVTGDRLKEAQYINKSLSSLGDVITALAQKNSHIPYRNSKLTQLLQDSLGGRAKTLMFAHVSPEEESYGETVSTLKFAQRVSTVELGAAHANKESHEVKELKEQVETLKKALATKPREVKSPQEKVKIMTDRTPPRPRRLSIENSFVKIEKSVDKDNKKVSKTPLIEFRTDIISRPRRLSLEPPKYGTDSFRNKGIGNKRVENLQISSNGVYKAENQPCVSPYSSQDTCKNSSSGYGVSAEASISSRNHSDASSVITVRRQAVPPPSPTSVFQSRIGGTESRMRRPIQIAKTPEPPSPQLQSPVSATSSTKKGSHIMRSLHSIGKLLNPSDKKSHQQSSAALSAVNGIEKTPPTVNARTLRRQSLVGDQSSGNSRRSSLGGKTAEPHSNGRRNAKTPPPGHPLRNSTRQWL